MNSGLLETENTIYKWWRESDLYIVEKLAIKDTLYSRNANIGKRFEGDVVEFSKDGCMRLLKDDILILRTSPIQI